MKKEGKMLVGKLVQEVETVEGEIKDLTKAIEKLRGDDWEEGIAKDERISVKLLYSSLTSAKASLRYLLSREIEFVESKIPEDII